MKFGTTLQQFQCGKWGELQFMHWEHPLNEPMRRYLTEEYIDAWAKYVKPGDVCVDIGGFTGDTAVIMSRLVEPAGWVYVFEPNPYIFEVLWENARLRDNITAIPLAVLDSPGFAEFHYTDDNFCNGGFITKVAAGIGFCGQTVPLKVYGCPLPAIVPRASVVKIDTEGYDRFVLESLHEFLQVNRPTLIVECFKGLNTEERRLLLDSVPPWYRKQEFYSGDPVDYVYAESHQHFDFVCQPQ